MRNSSVLTQHVCGPDDAFNTHTDQLGGNHPGCDRCIIMIASSKSDLLVPRRSER